MKNILKILLCAVLAAMLLALAGCGGNQTQTQVTGAAETATSWAASGAELKAQMEQYKADGNCEALYAAAQELMEQDPTDASAYTDAAFALLSMSKANYEEINRLLATAYENADTAKIMAWVEENEPGLRMKIPMLAGETNVEGITTGNLTNAAKFNGWWRGGLLTWQGSWVYLTRPDEDFAIYRMHADGSGYERLGEANGSSLNAVGEWLYYLNRADGDNPYKMRTDGSEITKLADFEAGFLSVSGDWMYCDGAGAQGAGLYKIKTDGGESIKMVDGVVIFPCVSGEWVYYCVKSAAGGLWRVPITGGQAQLVMNGFIQKYCIVDDWLYYIDSNEPYGVAKVHADGSDGTNLQMAFLCSAGVTTFNVAGDVLTMADGLVQDGETFYGKDFVAVDLNTQGETQRVAADAMIICVGPEGWVYFTNYTENCAWYAVAPDGAIQKVD